MPDIRHFDTDATLEAAMLLFWRKGMVPTGIQDVVTATGVNRSSLYATFGGKRDLYRAALGRYAERRAAPRFGLLTADDVGLPAVLGFFTEVVDTSCHGDYAGWGCMISNAHAGPESEDPEIRALLDRQYRVLADSLRSALGTARRLGQLGPGVDPKAAATTLALLTHGINLRSRTGVDPGELRATVSTTLLAVIGRPLEVSRETAGAPAHPSPSC
ncbi:TetR/AcrR family transcriptional regulator [Streptomyces sp. WMMC905]|uniref:TetR/AcrR family transcriptional regulator n=1 Tax=Streptomyces sp. WMMC905 TaxID=3404123 RepID=UPI003B95E9B1